MAQEGIKMFCDTTGFPSFTFCSVCKKPHGVQGMRKHYHMCLDPKLGRGDILSVMNTQCVFCEYI